MTKVRIEVDVQDESRNDKILEISRDVFTETARDRRLFAKEKMAGIVEACNNEDGWPVFNLTSDDSKDYNDFREAVAYAYTELIKLDFPTMSVGYVDNGRRNCAVFVYDSFLLSKATKMGLPYFEHVIVTEDMPDYGYLAADYGSQAFAATADMVDESTTKRGFPSFAQNVFARLGWLRDGLYSGPNLIFNPHNLFFGCCPIDDGKSFIGYFRWFEHLEDAEDAAREGGTPSIYDCSTGKLFLVSDSLRDYKEWCEMVLSSDHPEHPAAWPMTPKETILDLIRIKDLPDYFYSSIEIRGDIDADFLIRAIETIDEAGEDVYREAIANGLSASDANKARRKRRGVTYRFIVESSLCNWDIADMVVDRYLSENLDFSVFPIYRYFDTMPKDLLLKLVELLKANGPKNVQYMENMEEDDISMPQAISDGNLSPEDDYPRCFYDITNYNNYVMNLAVKNCNWGYVEDFDPAVLTHGALKVIVSSPLTSQKLIDQWAESGLMDEEVKERIMAATITNRHFMNADAIDPNQRDKDYKKKWTEWYYRTKEICIAANYDIKSVMTLIEAYERGVPFEDIVA